MSSGQNPPFCSQVRSSGLGEVWTHTNDDQKFNQFGWRCTTKEDSYSNDTLIGNWNEQRFDIEKQQKSKRLPSQYEHYFDSNYEINYNKQPTAVPKELVHLEARHPHSHPGHQPELDQPSLKAVYNSWETTSRAAYVHPQVRVSPLKTPQQTPQTK